jgi:hypothetical protein
MRDDSSTKNIPRTRLAEKPDDTKNLPPGTIVTNKIAALKRR